MERLTYRPDAPYTSKTGEYIEAYSDYEIRPIINRLAAYEDTGLSPADIADLRNELCLKCGKYHTAHLGSCDGCRWRA